MWSLYNRGRPFRSRHADRSRRSARAPSRPALEWLEHRIVFTFHPVFSNLSSPTNIYGTTPTTLSGSIADGANIPTGDNVKVTLNSVTKTVQVQSDGTFSSSFNTKTLGVSGSPYTVNYQFNAQSGYAATSGTGTLTVTPLALTATISASNKAYDSTTAATVTPSLTGVINGDDVSLVDGTSTFSSQNVGTWTVTDSGISLSGSGADNYTVNSTATDTAKITALPLTITAVYNSKAYDGTTSAAALPTITSGSLQGSDTANFIETYGSTNVNTGLTLTPSGTVNDGNSGNNYKYTFVKVMTGVITQEPLTITAATNTKTYDGTRSASAVPTITSGSLGTGDTASFSEQYGTANVGTGLTLTPSGRVIDGNGGNNYTYTFDTVSTGVISQMALTITAVMNTKTYDGTKSASSTPTITSGSVQTGDTASFSEQYGTPNVGAGLTLTPSGRVIDGNEGDNYTYTFDPVSTGVINAEALTITAVTNTKTYDNTRSASATPTITSGSVQSGDTANFSEQYGTANVGTGLTLTPSGKVNDGNEGDNYTYTFDPVSTGVINAEALTITAVTNTKQYDGTKSAAMVPTITSGSLQGGDTASFSEMYGTHNAGTSLTLTPSGRVIDGNGGNNYAYTFVPVSTGVITQAPLTVIAAVSPTDVGHGDTIPTPTFTYTGFVNGETSSVVSGTPGTSWSPTAPTTSSAAGVYTITPTVGSLTATNYDFTTFDPATLNIHPVVDDILVKWGTQSLSIVSLSRDLPFSGITKFEVEFSDDVDISGTGLTLTSTAGGPTYTPSLVGSGTGVTSATWTLPTAIGVDELLLTLGTMDITSVSGALSLYGTTSKAFSVLPGDVNGDGVVNSADVTAVINEIGAAYDVWADVTGTGTVTINDAKVARSKIGTQLPPLP